MKMRIQDNSIRFRITLKELATLGREGRVRRECREPGGGCLGYGVLVDQALKESQVRLGSCEVELALCEKDFRRLAEPTEEGVYVQREWTDANGEKRRFMAFVEKDRPGVACAKREEWIYEGHRGGESVVVPIGGKSAT